MATMTGHLDDLIPSATIYVSPDPYQGAYSRPSRWRIATTALQVDRDQVYTTAEAALAAARERGYVVVAETVDVHGMPRYELDHPETRAALDAAIAELDARWRGASPCYVRYGLPPEGGKSRNYADGTLERGVSVFRGQRLPGGEARPLPGSHVEIASMLSIDDRPLYIVEGREVGIGVDGEPVLADCRVVHAAA